MTGLPLRASAGEPPSAWDTYADTWVATDALGRSLPGERDAGPPRSGKLVGMFYFLWHGQHGTEGPFDISRIVAADPSAWSKPSSPPWGPLFSMHHWGEPLFGYYLSTDESVIRKHAQMLADAGVDVLIFDVTNGWTYPESYQALMRVFADIRSLGGRTPQIAFLCPFGNPMPNTPQGKVVGQLWRDIYQPALHPELWFRWEGKPLLLTDPGCVRDTVLGFEDHNAPATLEPGHSLGQQFHTDKPFHAVQGCFPTWLTTDVCLTLTLRQGNAKGKALATRRLEKIHDNAWLELAFDPPLPPGDYCLEAADAKGKVGWWSHTAGGFPSGEAIADGSPSPGDRNFRIILFNDKLEPIRKFFTFRKPEPSYFKGPSGPDQWSWLEVFPQHVFKNSLGEKEMISVGASQNAVGNRIGSMSEPESMGRSYHAGQIDRTPGAVNWGLNFAEQWQQALREDPQFVFVTGWNEWVAGRHPEFAGIRGAAIFPDECDQEHSRDIEPMKGGHGDNYYYQLVSAVRRFKGIRQSSLLIPRLIQIDGRFEDWREVEPEFRDDIGDPVKRDHPGWGHACRYINQSGRNDIIAARVSSDAANLYFYARCRNPISPCSEPGWMLLFINADQNPANGWLGYDFAVNRSRASSRRTSIEMQQGTGYHWSKRSDVDMCVAGTEIELCIPLSVLGHHSLPETLDFKWADGIEQSGDWSDFTLNGDVAPNDRFNYRARFATREPSKP